MKKELYNVDAYISSVVRVVFCLHSAQLSYVVSLKPTHNTGPGEGATTIRMKQKSGTNYGMEEKSLEQ